MTFQAKTPLSVFLCSWASLAFEVALTRIFSISLWYHFAFMIISIAMLGFAASGVALALYPGLKRIERIGSYCLLLGCAIPGCYLLVNRIPFDPVRLAWDNLQMLHLGLFYLVLALPFFCVGLVVATAFSLESGRAGLLYGADLIGAGAGSLGALVLLQFLAPERAVFLISLAPIGAGLLWGGVRLRAALLVPAAAVLLLLFLSPGFASLRISPYKGLPAALRYPGARELKTYHTPFARVDTFESPAVRFAPGLSLSYPEALPPQIGIAVDGGEVSAVTAAGRDAAPQFLEYLPGALPYIIGSPNRVLVLDPKGGLQVLMARRFGAGRIDKVEGNPALAAVLGSDLREFSGGIYQDRVWTGLGRSWLRGSGERFDIIDISLMGTEPYGSFGIAEEYRFTVEAFKEYLGSLERDGLLSVNLYILPPPRSELRILATVIQALEELGVEEPARHLAAIRSWGTLCLVAKRSPLTDPEIAAVKGFAARRWFDLLHYPGMRGEESDLFLKSPRDEYYRAFLALLSAEGRKRFMEEYTFDVAPVRDDHPFFGYFLKLGRVCETYRLMGEKWQFFLAEGYLVPAVFVQAALISLVLMVLPLFSGSRGGGKGRGLLPYFALLGLGFMLVEVALIQKIILPLENPSYAVATLLAGLLVSSGLGSLLGQRWERTRGPATCAVIALLILVYVVLLPAASAAISPLALPIKIGLVFLLLLPLGSLMGIPFPTGLRALGEADPALIPWAWVLNGTFSVLAPMLAIMFATRAGFSAVLYLGAAAYLLAFLNLRHFAKRAPRH